MKIITGVLVVASAFVTVLCCETKPVAVAACFINLDFRKLMQGSVTEAEKCKIAEELNECLKESVVGVDESCIRNDGMAMKAISILNKMQKCEINMDWLKRYKTDDRLRGPPKPGKTPGKVRPVVTSDKQTRPGVDKMEFLRKEIEMCDPVTTKQCYVAKMASMKKVASLEMNSDPDRKEKYRTACSIREQFLQCLEPAMPKCPHVQLLLSIMMKMYTQPPHNCDLHFGPSLVDNCEPEVIEECCDDMRKAKMKIKPKKNMSPRAMSSMKSDTNSVQMCGIGKKFKTCLMPVIKKCPHLMPVTKMLLKPLTSPQMKCDIDRMDWLEECDEKLMHKCRKDFMAGMLNVEYMTNMKNSFPSPPYAESSCREGQKFLDCMKPSFTKCPHLQPMTEVSMEPYMKHPYNCKFMPDRAAIEHCNPKVMMVCYRKMMENKHNMMEMLKEEDQDEDRHRHDKSKMCHIAKEFLECLKPVFDHCNHLEESIKKMMGMMFKACHKPGPSIGNTNSEKDGPRKPGRPGPGRPGPGRPGLPPKHDKSHKSGENKGPRNDGVQDPAAQSGMKFDTDRKCNDRFDFCTAELTRLMQAVEQVDVNDGRDSMTRCRHAHNYAKCLKPLHASCHKHANNLRTAIGRFNEPPYNCRVPVGGVNSVISGVLTFATTFMSVVITIVIT